MKAYYVTFRSVTPAQRAERTLEQAGISCALQRTPRWMEKMGCGYCLRIPYAKGEMAVKVLQGAGVDYRKIYHMQENGRIEDVQV